MTLQRKKTKQMREEATLHLPVTVDKSHIITPGERLYGESIELVRELVNNACDADASRVNVQISKNEIVVEDDGNSMDLTFPTRTIPT